MGCTGSDINNAPSINYKLFRFLAFKHNGTVYHWKRYSNCDPKYEIFPYLMSTNEIMVISKTLVSKSKSHKGTKQKNQF